MAQLWSDPARLHDASNFMQWFGIVLIFLGGFLQVGPIDCRSPGKGTDWTTPS